MKVELKKLDKEEIRTIPKSKIDTVERLGKEMKQARTVLLASCRGLPSRQFNEIKKKLRGTASLNLSKKSLVLRAIDSTGKGALIPLKEHVDADVVVFFSEMEPFELSSLLTESQSATKAKAGDKAPEDITIEPGPTDLVAGPAISELSAVGLKVAVKEGKLEIIKGNTVAKKGEAIAANVAAVLSKLNITPIKVGFRPIAAYDAKDDKIYANIVIDKKGAHEALLDAITKSLAFAVGREYYAAETIKFFIAKAGAEEKALAHKVNTHTTVKEETA